METKKPPVFLDLRLIKMPPAAIASIGHRASGVFIALLIPLMLYLIDLSLSSQEGFNQATLLMESTAAKIVLMLVLWAFFHHLFAGIRFLFADIHIGVNREQGRLTALVVLAAAPAAAIIVGLIL